MLDFQKELDKLLSHESEITSHTELEALTNAGKQLLTALNKKQADISMQVEEIYDMVREADTSDMRDTLRSETARADRLAKTVIGLCNIMEDFCAFAMQSGSDELNSQAMMMWKNSNALLEECAITRLGEVGQRLNPDIHKVQSVSASEVPREHVAMVLQSGYRYMGTVARKAVVIVSMGMEETENGQTGYK